MLNVENIGFRYSKFSRPVLRGASLELKPGEIGIVLGKNGSGKTTLFKNLLGIHKPESGNIRFEGEDLLKMSRKERSRRIAYVPQDIHFGALTVFDSIMLGHRACEIFRNKRARDWSDNRCGRNFTSRAIYLGYCCTKRQCRYCNRKYCRK